MEYLLLILGFAILIFSGDFLVKGGVEIAKHFKISPLVVGVTVVSFGTSAPELFVSIDAALDGSPDITLGNVIGSNIANIALVLGLTAIILPIPVKSKSIKFDWPVMFLASILLFVFGLDNKLNSYECIFFVLAILWYIIHSIYFSRKETKENGTEKANLSIIKSIAIIILSSIGLYYGADLLVNNAKEIALTFGVSERVIGLTLIAFGTSVPELATSVIAASKKQLDISIGNIIGSNIFNIFAVLGITGIIKPINVTQKALEFDLIWMIAIALLLFLFILPLKNGIISRLKGLAFFIIYITYSILLFIK